MRHRLNLALRLAGLALFLFVTGGPAVIAENDGSALKFFLQERAPAPLRLTPIPRAIPLPASSGRAARRPMLHRDQPHLAALAANSEKPVAAPAFVTAVIGDSLGVLMQQGLMEAFADRPEMAFLRKARESSGLVREDYYDWPKNVRDLLNAPEHLDLVVMMIGSNDHQAIRDGNDYVDALTPRWREIYGNRVEALAAQFRARNIPLVWVGMPIMKNERMSGDMIQFNEIYRERAGKAGAIYIDIWEAFLNQGAKYDAIGPDVNGEMAKLRTADGVHVTKAGARKLAHFVEADVKRAYEAVTAKSDPALAVLTPPPPVREKPGDAPASGAAAIPFDADITLLLRRQINGDAGGGANAGTQTPVLPSEEALQANVQPQSPQPPTLQAALPLPAEPASLYFPLRPSTGAVTLLTGPSLSADGELARHDKAGHAASPTQTLVEQAFAEGRLPRARPGRADHFAWPK